MKNILIYKAEDNLCITHFVKNLDAQAVHKQAQKMLPFGVLYRIGTTEEIPQDRTFRDAWDINDSDLNDGIGGEEEAKNLLATSDNDEEKDKYQQKLNELLAKLPPENRRGYIEPEIKPEEELGPAPETQEPTDDKN